MRLDLLVNDFVYRAVHREEVLLFEGEFRRNFLHVRDAATAVLVILWAKPTWTGQYVFNVGDSRANMSKLTLCETILRHIPGFRCSENINAGTDQDRMDYVVSNAKFERATEWYPRYSIDDGILQLKVAYAMPFEQVSYKN